MVFVDETDEIMNRTFRIIFGLLFMIRTKDTMNFSPHVNSRLQILPMVRCSTFFIEWLNFCSNHYNIVFLVECLSYSHLMYSLNLILLFYRIKASSYCDLTPHSHRKFLWNGTFN